VRRFRARVSAAEQVIPGADVAIDDAQGQGLNVIEAADRVEGGETSGVGLTESLGPLQAQ
jgi:hypothetical protein